MGTLSEGVFRHRTWARALVCTRFHQPCFYPCFPVIWSFGGDKIATPQQIETKLMAPWCLSNIPFSARAQCPGTGTKSGQGLKSFLSHAITTCSWYMLSAPHPIFLILLGFPLDCLLSLFSLQRLSMWVKQQTMWCEWPSKASGHQLLTSHCSLFHLCRWSLERKVGL